MSKAKDEYSKQVAAISFISHYSTGPIVNYVTELEKKAEMFDEIVNQLSILYYGYEGINYTLKPLLFRAKEIQEAGELWI